MFSIQIIAFEQKFVFELREKECAWYDLDGSESHLSGWKMVLNADREVYAGLEMPDGSKHFGTIGDEENETIPDNFGIESGEEYIFYENPDTEEYYV